MLNSTATTTPHRLVKLVGGETLNGELQEARHDGSSSECFPTEKKNCNAPSCTVIIDRFHLLLK